MMFKHHFSLFDLIGICIAGSMYSNGVFLTGFLLSLCWAITSMLIEARYGFNK